MCRLVPTDGLTSATRSIPQTLHAYEIEDRVEQEHGEAGGDRDQDSGDEIVDRRPSQEGGEQCDGDRETDACVNQEVAIARCDAPLGPAIDPGAAEHIMDRIAGEEADCGG